MNCQWIVCWSDRKIGSRRLTVRCGIVYPGLRSAVGEGHVTDAKERPCATASTSCLVFGPLPA